MRVHVYEQLMAMQASRRQLMKGAAGAAAALATSGPLSLSPSPAYAADSVVSQIMKIPGAGNGSPTDADWQKVGALCLGPTKENVKPGEFKGVEFSFMGLNNQNLHNFLFRGFLKPWEAYTGASIKWIDLAQADYNARLQQSIATGTVDFDIIEMGAPFEGDMGVKDLLVRDARLGEEAGRFRRLRQLPQAAGRHMERQDPSRHHRQRLPHDEQTHRHLLRPDLAKDWKDWKDKADLGEWGAPKTWPQVQAVTKFLKGKKVKGKEVYGFLDQPKPWGGFCFYFLCSRATAYAKYPGEKNWLFDENMKPQVNNPAFVRAIQDVVDALPYEPADQINADPGTTAFQQFLTGTGSLLEWWGDIGTVAKTSDTATIGDMLDFDILPASPDVYNFRKKQWEKLATGPERRAQHGLSRLGHLCDEDGRRRSASARRRHGARRPISAARTCRCGRRPIRRASSPTARATPISTCGCWPATTASTSAPTWTRSRRRTTTRTRRSSRASPASSSTTASRKTNCRGCSPARRSAQQGADKIAAAWENLTDKLGRENQVKYYRIAMGLT